MGIFKEILIRNPEVIKKIDQTKIKSKKVLIIAISSDRGLAGAFDLNIFEKTKKIIEDFKKQEKEILLGVIGKKGENYFKKRTPLNFSFSKFEGLFPEDFARELINYIQFLIEKEKIEKIIFIRPNLTPTGYFVEEIEIFPFTFETLEGIINKILPKVKEWQILKEEKTFKYNFEYFLEPSEEKIMEVILKNVFYSLIYVIILSAQASLELARTITMQRAEKNSRELIQKTTIDYNKLRQSKITQELIELKTNL